MFVLSLLSRDIYNNTEFPMERIVNLRPVSGTMGPSDWNEALDIIASDSPEQVVFPFAFSWIRRGGFILITCHTRVKWSLGVTGKVAPV